MLNRGMSLVTLGKRHIANGAPANWAFWRVAGCYSIQVGIRRSADGTSLGGDLGPEISALLGARTSDVLTLHFTLGIHYNACVVLKVQKVSFTTADRLALTNNNGGKHLFTELRLTLLDGAKEHVANGAGGETIKASTEASHGNHVQVLGASVISAVHGRSHRQTVWDFSLDARTATSSYIRENWFRIVDYCLIDDVSNSIVMFEAWLLTSLWHSWSLN